MNDFIIVFQFTDYASKLTDAYVSLGVGVVGALVIGLIVFRCLRKNSDFNSLSKSGFLLLFIVLYLCNCLLASIIYTSDYSNLLYIYNNNLCQVVEGTVNVLHVQPREGHDKGDIVSINGAQFVINYYNSDVFTYRNTIMHGGVLNDGAYVRIFNCNERIIKVEVKRSVESKP
jgi:hypothetical protein